MFASVLYPDVVNQIIVVDSQLFDAADIAKMMAHGVSADNADPKTNRHYGFSRGGVDAIPTGFQSRKRLALRARLRRPRIGRPRRGRLAVEIRPSLPTMLHRPVPTPPPTCAVTVIRGEHGIMNPDKAEAPVDGRADQGARW